MARELPTSHLGETVRDLLADKISEKAAAHDRSTAKGRFQAEALEAISDRLTALEMWTRVPAGRRRPRLSRDDLAATAVQVADAEGMAALSMRRLAAELDVGTMTLYHYVRTKDELLTVVVDAVMGEVVVPDDVDMPADWRAALTLVATRSRDALRRHPWILDITDDPPIGPNSLRHFDQSLQAVASLDVPLTERLDIVGLVDEFVFGFCLMERNNLQTEDLAAEEDMVTYLDALLETGAYPHLEALVAEHGVRNVWEAVHDSLRDAGRFERNLRRLLDGVHADLTRRGRF